MTEPWEAVSKDRVRRWKAGAAEHRRSPGDPFVGDPLQCAYEELVDLCNYLGEERPGRLQSAELDELRRRALEMACHLWIRLNPNGNDHT